ncbi:NADH:ubiquinone oxidoreductase 11.5kD subunit [Plectosphaerella plurivora]|uniref:NADH dehydrogenase [ubiquinone] iron-sulfur protein 5 n=1 Tax=Plectosphaerella plurivora TaxID=936078 RepID=A0A9P9A709_9PEZI|nr:NADH:ubiquinone oxidoreductase 11.5kD subunit [Plectosphaerella plurivora]
MASGYGANGGPGRCFPFWQELLGCYAVNSAEDDGKGKAKCGPALEDYYECLHHKKEAARTRALQAAYRQVVSASARDSAPSASNIRGLGTLTGDEDTKLVAGA